MMHTHALALIPLAPAAAFLLLIVTGRWWGRASALVAIAAMAVSTKVTLLLWPSVLRGATWSLRWPVALLEHGPFTIGLHVDPLGLLMLTVVTVIGTLIQVYAIGYMRDDPRFSRFFAYLSLFCSSMLLLVLADNLPLLYVGWELVGLCSYLLISFWFEKPAAAAAGKKAFITTRLGDAGLLLGILMLYLTTRQLRFDALPALQAQLMAAGQTGLLTLVSLLIFSGAVGKSAQFPLHVWLPDAMEGPTPVSALIHAATMVAAGVYLVARSFVLFTPQSLAVVAAIGTFTALLAATIALTQHDIKRVLAYSTLSQLGFMMAALGVGGREAGMFHLATHACFKALLFLCAGSVIHAVHHQDLRQMGGLRRALPWTFATCTVATLAISGIWPLAGFWSKDAILAAAATGGHPVVFWALVAASAMTSGYMFRLLFLAFFGASRAATGGHHGAPHESPAVMTAPLAILALGAIIVGLPGSPWMHFGFQRFLAEGASAPEVFHRSIAAISTLAALAGLAGAWRLYIQRQPLLASAWRRRLHGLYEAAAAAYRFDHIYDRWLIQPTLGIGRALARFDQGVIDGAVNGLGRLGWALGQCKGAFDRVVVDGLVNAVGASARAAGGQLRRVQTGDVQQYLLALVLTVTTLVVWQLR